jgi:ceramide glucosyltransferase
MPHILAQSVALFTTLMAIAGIAYFLVALVAARVFLILRKRRLPAFAPGVSILKSLKGCDPEMIDAFRSHCRQTYTGEYEILFGISSVDEDAAVPVQHLKLEFPERSIRLFVCPALLGANGKVSTLAQLLPHARFDHILINDSDIAVTPHYLEGVMAHFAPTTSTKPQREVGLVTTLYRGHAHVTFGSRLEALGIATDFQAGVLLSRLLQGGLRYGLGSTLAVSRSVLKKIGGLESMVDYLADDHELGKRVYAAGYAVALSGEVVETSIPEYSWTGFLDHQLRWARTIRDASPGGYVGLVFTHGFAWALLNVMASGISLLSLWLLALSFFLRLALAMTVGAEVLADHQVLPRLWMLPLRDLIGFGLWIAGFAGDSVVWRGERFQLKNGKLTRSPD